MTKESVPQPPVRKEYTHREVSELFAPLRAILDALREDIEAGTYEVIVGDDASGRIPALAMDRFLRRRYEDLGYPAPKTRFVAGSGSGTEKAQGAEEDAKRAALAEFMRGLRLSENKRVLIVTDVVLSGGSLTPLMEALHGLGMPFDIATVGFDEKLGEAAREFADLFGARIFAGGSGLYPGVFKRHDIAGVVKEKRELHARPYRGSAEYRDWRNWPQWIRPQRSINAARDDVEALADALTKAYENPAP